MAEAGTGDVLLVTGTHAEAGALPDHAGLAVLPGGADAGGLTARLAELAPGAAGIISFGTCGALDPALRVGDWVVGSGLVGASDLPCDARWGEVLAARLPVARRGLIYADGRLLGSAAMKAEAFACGALVVDMESHLAGEAARAAGLPFAVLRCVSDNAEAMLPPAILAAMRPDGGLAPGAMLASVARQPGQLPALVHALRGFFQAFRVLKRDGALVAPGRLGFDLR